MKRRIFVVGALALMLGGALAAWRQADGPIGAGSAERPEARGPSGELLLDPFVLPIMQEGRVTRHLTLRISLELADPRERERALAVLPRLQDALLQELHGLYSLKRVRDTGFDSVFVHQRLALAGERILGPGKISSLDLAILENRKPGV